MKSLQVQMFKSLSMAALLMAGAAFTACTSDELNPEPQQTDEPKTYTMTIEATKGGDEASTRALSLEGKTLNATWAEGEEVKVHNDTKNADLEGTLTAQSSGTSTTLTGTLTGTVEAGDVLTLKFLSPNYSSQKGTLEYIAANCDYATATVEVASVSGGTITTTDNADFVNQQAIVRFALKRYGGTAIHAFSFAVDDGTNIDYINPDLNEPLPDIFYVALPAVNNGTVTLTAISGDEQTPMCP